MWKIWRSSRECCCVLLALLIGPPPGRPAASRAARSQQSSSLHPQEPLMSSSSLSVTPKSYFCLIGGESCDTQGADLHRREYLHTSLFFVGKVRRSEARRAAVAEPSRQRVLYFINGLIVFSVLCLCRRMISCEPLGSPDPRLSR